MGNTQQPTSAPLDPVQASVHYRIEELRRSAAVDALAREARPRRRRSTPRWPGSVVTALRETFTRAGAPASQGTAPCATC